MIRARASASPNFALVKYWGKADDAAMIPASPSLSITLDGPRIDVRLEPLGAGPDEVNLDSSPVPEPWRARTQRFLDLVRAMAGSKASARVDARGGPRPASGLASSAAYYAALAAAASRAFGLPEDPATVSDLARRGSVSAARSVIAGFASLDPARERNGRLAAEMLFGPEHWDLSVIIAVVDPGAKEVPSSEGMRRTRETSIFYEAWISSARGDHDACREAIALRNIEVLCRISESNCLRMHASAMAARPPIVYLTAGTLLAIERIRELRSAGIPCFFTVDAGPQVKVVCRQEDEERVREGMRAVQGIHELLSRRPGPGADISPD